MGMWGDEFKRQFKWFKDCNDIEEGQKLYRALLMKYHPDQGGDEATCTEIVAEWEKFVKAAATRIFVEQKEGTQTAEQTEESKRFSEQFFQVLDEVMQMNCHVEIIGTWIWVFGATLFDPVKLEAMDFHYSKKHKGYWWNGMDKDQVFKIMNKYKNRPVPNLQLDDLRKMWGSEVKRGKEYIG